MTPSFRSLAALVVAAHVWASAMPCPPDPALETSRSRVEPSRVVAVSATRAAAPANGGSHAGHAHGSSDVGHAGHAGHSSDADRAGHAGHSSDADRAGHAGHAAQVRDATAPAASPHAHQAHHAHHAHHSPHARDAADAERVRHEADRAAAAQALARQRPQRAFVPVCPCGCDAKTPTAGASSVRIGVGVPPEPECERAVPARIVVLAWQTPALPDVTPKGVDPVPRPRSIG